MSLRVSLLLKTKCQKGVLQNVKRLFSVVGMENKYIPRRSLMYVPGHDIKKLEKIPTLNIDCAVLECEDGVALNRKAEARQNIRTILGQLDFGQSDPAVRINSVSSGLFTDDLEVILSANKLPQTILLPKVDTVNELETFTETFRNIIEKNKKENYRPYLIIYAESATGLLNLISILEAACSYSAKGIYRIDGVVFGSDDYCADIGATRTSEAGELVYARQMVVMTAKAYRLQAIDMVSIDLKDLQSLKRQSSEGARMGFTGKQIIHPSQIAIVNEAFTPSSDRIEWATQLIKSFEEHQISGKGAFTFRGNMIDMPLLLQAKNILQLMDNITRKQ